CLNRHRLALDEVLMPEREVEDDPRGQPFALVNEAERLPSVEDVRARAEPVDRAARGPAEPIEEPLVHGDPESLLGAIDELVGDDAAYGLLQAVLQRPVPDLHLGGDAHGELDEL